MNEWEVSLDNKVIDSVFFTHNMNEEDVFKSLMNDGYDPNINIKPVSLKYIPIYGK